MPGRSPQPQQHILATYAQWCYNDHMPKAYKYRISPTKGQQRILNMLLEECRYVYHQTLAVRREMWNQLVQ